MLGTLVLLCATQSMAARITFYESEGFRGRVFSTDRSVVNLAKRGFNDRAASVIVEDGRWEVCDDSRFGGRCTLLRPGSYDSLQRMGMDRRISSVRQVNGTRQYEREAPEPLAAPTYDYRRRPEERTHEVPVTSVHAIFGPPEQRCWVEREQVTENDRGRPNVGGAIAGAIIGGVLGHQIGGGRGKDLATVGGVVAGGAIGANAGRRDGNSTTYDQDVRRCENTADTTPDYWDVAYTYHNVEHRVQMSSPPDASIIVNDDGEPRG